MNMNYVNNKRYLAGHLADGEKLAKLNMRGTRAASSKWIKCVFDSCHFDASTFTGALFDRCIFNNCTFQNSGFSGATILESEFRGCDLIQCDFSGATVKQSGFPSCRMEYATFFDADVKDVVFSGANLTGAFLIYASQSGVNYTGASLHDVAFRFGCKFFRGAKFDTMQWQMFQALVSYGTGYDSYQTPVMERVNPKIVKMVADLVEKGHEE